MRILVIKSSGNKNGSSNMIADEFIRGAKESGNAVAEFDVMRKDIRPCLGCNHCGMNGDCVQQDDFENDLKWQIREADMLAFVMPVYYYNWPAQLKTVVDRFYSFTMELTRMHKKAALLAVAWDDTKTVFTITQAYFQTLCDYMEFDNVGIVLGGGCGTPELTSKSPHMQEAYELGKSVKD